MKGAAISNIYGGRIKLKIQCPDCKNLITVEKSNLGLHLTRFCMKLGDREAAVKFFNSKIYPIQAALDRNEITEEEALKQMITTFSERKSEVQSEQTELS